MKFDRNACVVVDAFSTGQYLPSAFRGRGGYPCIHIQSSKILPDRFKHNESDFSQSLVYDGTNLEEILMTLREYHVKCVVAGSESGIELTDLINQRLDLPGNKPELSRARRDKFLMTEIIAAAGLKTVKHFKSKYVDDIIHWAQQMGAFPIVLKPLESQSGDHVLFCYNEYEIRAAFQKIIGSINLFGQTNQEVLVQTFNPGQEYIINTVTCQGKHYPVEIWRVTRLPDTTIYDAAELIHPDEPEFDALFAYTQRVLDTMGIENGPGTTEVKYTPEGGPVLLETTSRPMAGAPLSLSHEMYGYTQISLTAEAYLSSRDFLRRIEGGMPKLRNHAMAVMLISDVEGELQRDLDLSGIRSLETFNSLVIDAQVGKSLVRTVDTLTSPGEIYLVSPSREAILRDFGTIRRWERGLYRTALQRGEPTSLAGLVSSVRSNPVSGSNTRNVALERARTLVRQIAPTSILPSPPAARL